MTESFFTERGLCYRVNRFEKSRKTLVFVHGLSGSSSAWRDYETFFGTDYNILTFDLRGHGKSVKPKSYRDYYVGRFADDLNALLDFLHIDACVLIGHSFGAAVVLEFMLAHPGIAPSAVFLAPDFHTKGIRLSRLVFPMVGWVAAVSRLFPIFKHEGGCHVNYDRYRDTGDWNIRRMAADISNTGLHVYFYSLRQLYKFDRESSLKDISVPVLIVHGSEDTVVPVENSVTMAKKMSNARLTVLRGANHILVLNRSEEVSKLIADFVRSINTVK